MNPNPKPGEDKRAKQAQAGPIIIPKSPARCVSYCVLLLCRPTAVSVASEAQVEEEGEMVEVEDMVVVVVVVVALALVVVSTSATVDVPVVPPVEVLGLAKTQTS